MRSDLLFKNASRSAKKLTRRPHSRISIVAMPWSASLQSEKRLKLDAKPKKMHKESADARLRKLLVASKKK